MAYQISEGLEGGGYCGNLFMFELQRLRIMRFWDASFAHLCNKLSCNPVCRGKLSARTKGGGWGTSNAAVRIRACPVTVRRCRTPWALDPPTTSDLLVAWCAAFMRSSLRTITLATRRRSICKLTSCLPSAE